MYLAGTRLNHSAKATVDDRFFDRFSFRWALILSQTFMTVGLLHKNSQCYCPIFMDEIQMDLPQSQLPTSLLGFQSPLSLQNSNPPKPTFRIPQIYPQPCRLKPPLIHLWKRMSSPFGFFHPCLHRKKI